MKLHGWAGLVILALGEVALYAGVPLVAVYFTPLMWTGYILLVDGWVAQRAGASWLTTRRREFPLLALVSVLTWLLFEAYNLKLMNWAYIGLPPNAGLTFLGFLWSYATITPALFETADLLAAWRRQPLWPAAGAAGADTGRGSDTWLAVAALAGLAFVTIPVLLPAGLAAYTFGLVWLGFVPLLEPALLRTGQPSLLREWLAGRRAPALRYLAAGLVCGLIWEAWNVQTLSQGGAGWLYTMPAPIQNLVFGLHYGQMPVAGLLGFPPFALECFALYYFVRLVLSLDRMVPAAAAG